nr:AAA family ATPase [Chloroflexota bacterium]
MVYEVPVEELRNICNPQDLDFSSTDQVEPLVGILGQERALQALRFGLAIQSEGFNIYVAGRPGTGRTKAVMSFLEELAKDKPTPPDWCYVNNFRDPYRPKAVCLPAGQAKQFRNDMERLISEIRKRIPLAFESEQYANRREAITKAFEEQRQHILAQLDQTVQQMGFRIQISPTGLLLVPMKDGKPMSEQEFAALTEEQRQQIIVKRIAADAEVNTAMKQAHLAEKKSQEQLREIDRETALIIVHPLIEDLEEKYKTSSDVVSYLTEVQDSILQNLARFRGEEEPQPAPSSAAPGTTSFFRRYEVNVMVDNSELHGAPVLTELNLTYHNLFGRIEREAEFGAFVTDFTMLKGGALHRANGGYLVLPVEPLLDNPITWDGLKRALSSKQINIEDVSERLGAVPVKSVRPEPIPLNVKVVLIGDPRSYYLLYGLDPDFSELFKVKADFDVRMERSAENVRAYIAFISGLCRKEGLRHFRREAAAKIVEYGSALAGDQRKLSTHFAQIADVVREASLYAEQDNTQYVTEEHVRKAIDARIHRSDMLQQHIRESMIEGTILIDTDGEMPGQVNGLSVLSLGDYQFGYPTRITATIGLGRDGVLDIEREAKLGGPVHTKGVLILSGYLTRQYAQDKPLTLSARVVFEQSYQEVEGDSASSAELYALLSALSELPIQQGIAVTGSINQWGQLQSVGGINEKIEGFFDLCAGKGLTGKQGIIIPRSNVKNLMLKEAIIEAVRQGLFHVYAVDNVDQGLEILTGIPAGTRGTDGKFPEGSVHARIDARLRKLAEDLHQFGKEAD